MGGDVKERKMEDGLRGLTCTKGVGSKVDGADSLDPHSMDQEEVNTPNVSRYLDKIITIPIDHTNKFFRWFTSIRAVV